MSQVVAFGPFTLNIYTLLIALAVLACVLIGYWQRRDAWVFAAALCMGASALAFARAGYIALNWDYFSEHSSEIVGLTGLSEHAAILGGTLGYLLISKRIPLPAFSILNSQFLIAIAASLGCIPNGCAYGREVFWQTDGANSLAWLLRVDWPDAYLVNNPRWPTQLFMVGWFGFSAGVLFIWTRWQRRQGCPLPPCRLVCSICLISLSFAIGDLLIQFLRGDPTLMLMNLRIYQWFDVFLIGLGLLALALTTRRTSILSRTPGAM